MRVLLTILTVYGCGTLPATTEEKPEGNPPNIANFEANEPPPPIVESAPYARLVQTASDLNACDQTSRGALVYIADAAEFRYCTTADTWEPIVLRGKDGTNGNNGTDGVAGPKGDKGDPGRDGTNGRDGQDGRDGDMTMPWIFAADGTPIGYAADPKATTNIPMILETGHAASAITLADGFSADSLDAGTCNYAEDACQGACYAGLGFDMIIYSGGTNSFYGSVSIAFPDTETVVLVESYRDKTGACVDKVPTVPNTVFTVTPKSFPLPWSIKPRVYPQQQ